MKVLEAFKHPIFIDHLDLLYLQDCWMLLESYLAEMSAAFPESVILDLFLGEIM
jgi:hypothetical protein